MSVLPCVDNSVAPATAPAANLPKPVVYGSSAETRDVDSVVPPAEKDEQASWRTPVWVSSTYFAEGLPYSIVHQVVAEFFTAMGASFGAIGLTSLYGLAWNAKFAWAPFVDRFGTARRWLVAVQALLAVTVLALAWPAGSGDLGTVARMLVVVSILAATHDIAIDGFYLRALGKKNQAAFSGLRVGAYRGALLVGKGVLVVIAGKTSWFVCFALAGAILGVMAVIHHFALPRPQRGDLKPSTTPTAEVKQTSAPKPPFAEAFRTFFTQPAIGPIIAFILLFRAGDALMFAMTSPFLKHLGLDTSMRGVVSGTAGTVASILGSVFGGWLISRLELRRTLFPIAFAQSAAIPLFVLLAATTPSVAMIAGVVVIEQFIAGVGTAAFMVFLMRRCSGDYKASHFAISTALMSVAATVAGSTSGYLAESVGFTTFFLIAFLVSIPGVVLARAMPASASAG